MSDGKNIITLLKEWAPIVGPVFIAAIVFWLQANFVARSEFEKVSDRLGKVETALLLLAEQNKAFERIQRVTDDHESRLRELEKRK